MMYFGEILINGLMVGGGEDISTATAKASDILYPKTAFTAEGEVQGTCTFDADTKDATMVGEDLLSGKTGYKDGEKVVGTMPNNGDVSSAIENGVLKKGYTTGGEISNLVPENIMNGVNIGGVIGTGNSVTKVTGTIMTGSSTREWVYVDIGWRPTAVMGYLIASGTQTLFAHVDCSITSEPCGGWNGERGSDGYINGQQLVRKNDTGFQIRPLNSTGTNLTLTYEAWKLN